MTEGAPKSAFELAMEKLRRRDEEAGVETAALTDAQREAIADVRRAYDAQVAERRILHQAALAKTPEPEARQALEANHRRDLGRFAADRDRKMARIREGAAAQPPVERAEPAS